MDRRDTRFFVAQGESIRGWGVSKRLLYPPTPTRTRCVYCVRTCICLLNKSFQKLHKDGHEKGGLERPRGLGYPLGEPLDLTEGYLFGADDEVQAIVVDDGVLQDGVDGHAGGLGGLADGADDAEFWGGWVGGRRWGG